MPKVKIYKQSGAEAGEMELNAEVFGAEYNQALIHQVVVAQLANARQGTKSTLTRAEVRGGGRKPWRQKHTGRARQGSTRAPQWIKGGVVFAPKPRDFSQKINKQMKFEAFKSALSQKVADDEVIVLEDLTLTAPKTREMAQLLENLKLSKSVMIIVDKAGEDLLTASRNIPNLTIGSFNLLSTYDVVRHGKLVFLKKVVDQINSIEEDAE